MSTAAARARLRLLDACLAELEEAHEREEQILSHGLATTLGEHVRALVPGMSISQAIEVVLREQEPFLMAVTATSAEPLDERAAGRLTGRIREAGQHFCLLLLEAHERHAPAALGYRSWEDYVRRELGLSRRRSYEILDQGRVVRAVRDAAGVCGIPHISASAAADVKAWLDEMTAVIRQRTADRTEEERMVVVRQVVRRYRARSAIGRAAPTEPRRRAARLVRAVNALTSMPSPDEISRLITVEQARRLEGLREALRWLSEFADAWEERDVARLAS